MLWIRPSDASSYTDPGTSQISDSAAILPSASVSGPGISTATSRA